MTGRYSDQDVEHYDRPRRRTRPRTKERPSYDDAEEAVVVTVDRGRFTLLLDGRTVTAMKARPLGRKGVVVGDRVRVVGDTSGSDGSLSRIVEVTERSTVLRRTADDDDPVERVIVANADQ
ncbi:MAG: ribosome small subunit-dependent GTPase A, partial [Nocardioides sp.]